MHFAVQPPATSTLHWPSAETSMQPHAAMPDLSGQSAADAVEAKARKAKVAGTTEKSWVQRMVFILLELREG